MLAEGDELARDLWGSGRHREGGRREVDDGAPRGAVGDISQRGPRRNVVLRRWLLRKEMSPTPRGPWCRLHDSGTHRPRQSGCAFPTFSASGSRPCHGGGVVAGAVLTATVPGFGKVVSHEVRKRCRAEATSTGPGGQRLCDKHYNPTMAAAPGMVGTGTAADALGAFIVAKGDSAWRPRPGLAHQSLSQRVRQRFAR